MYWVQVSGQHHLQAGFPPGKEPPYPLYRRLDGPHCRTGKFGKENVILSLPGIRAMSRPSRSLVQSVLLIYEFRFRLRRTGAFSLSV
jgi:hypothetical protein